MLTFVLMPDTPHFHLSKRNRQEAVKSLKYLRGKESETVDDELEEIRASLVNSLDHKSNIFDVFRGKANLMGKNDLIVKLHILFIEQHLSAMTILLGLTSFQNFSGIDAVLFYSETILNKAGSSLDPSVATILNGVVMLIASVVSSIFVDRSGRKGLLLVSAAGMAISLSTMGLYFYLDTRDMTSELGWLPIASLITFITFYCVGFGPLPFTLLGEIFAPEIKSMAISIAVSACWISDFAVTKLFLPLESVVGNYGSFWIFAGFCVMAFIFTYMVVFETKGLTLLEIQDRLNGRNPSTNARIPSRTTSTSSIN